MADAKSREPEEHSLHSANCNSNRASRQSTTQYVNSNGDEYELPDDEPYLSSSYLHPMHFIHDSALNVPVYTNSLDADGALAAAQHTVTNPGEAYENIPQFSFDLRAKNLNTENIKHIQIPEKANVLLLDFNELYSIPDAICLPHIAVLSVASQIFPKRASFADSFGLKVIPEIISRMCNLRELCISNNVIEEIPSSFRQLKNLQILNLNSNCLMTLPVAVCEVRTLKELHLSGNLLENLPKDIAHLSRLKVLRLGNNRLTDIPAEITKLRELICLSLRNNQIRELPPEMYDMSVMHDVTADGRGISISGNPLQHPPIQLVKQDGIKGAAKYLKARSLQSKPMDSSSNPSSPPARNHHEVDISQQHPPLNVLSLDTIGPQQPEHTRLLNASGNRIAHIDPNISALKRLEKLILDRNAFDDIPIGILQYLSNLQFLSVRNQVDTSPQTNKEYQILQIIPNNIYLCKHLKELYLSQNRIKDIASGVVHLYSLQVLDMTDNKLKTIPIELCDNLKSLVYLGLTGNDITILPSNIGNMSQLKVLRLSDNKLTELPKSICNMKSLITLSLSHNPLICLPFHFYKLTALLSKSQASSYNNDYIGGQFTSSLRLKGTEATMVYPSPEICNTNGKVNVENMFATMKYVANHPDIMKSEMRKIQHHLRKPVVLAAESGKFHYLSDVILTELSNQIGKDWTTLGVHLGLDSNTVQQIDHDHVRDMKRASFEMLRKWRNSKVGQKGETGLLDDLIEALGQPSVGRQDIRRKLVQSKQEF